MVKLEPIGLSNRHFILRANTPVRVEVQVVAGVLHASVYEGTQDDQEQEPLFVFDGHIHNKPVIG